MRKEKYLKPRFLKSRYYVFLNKNFMENTWVDYQYIFKRLDYKLLIHDYCFTGGKGTYNNGAKFWRCTEAKLVIGQCCSIAHEVNFIVDEGYHKGSVVRSYPFYNNKSESNLVSIKETEGIIIRGVKVGQRSHYYSNFCRH